jgi:hypothetical protein
VVNLKPVNLCVIQEWSDGVVKSEFLHEMSESRIRDLVGRRDSVGRYFFSKDIRDLASLEIRRRCHNSLVSRYIGDVDFRGEVVRAMMFAGVDKRVAENLTGNESETIRQGRKYGVI